MPNLVPIGRFSQITQLSIKALRLYAEQGLLCPKYVDPDSGYRYYSLAQTQAAARIRLLRQLEMPLEEIRAVIHAENPEAVRFLLVQHQERIAGRIRQHQHALILLQRLLENKEELVSYPVKVKEVTTQPILSIRIQTPPEAFDQAVPSASQELIDYVERLGVRSKDLPPLIILHTYTEEMADIEVGIPVERTVAGEGRITSNVLAGGPVAYIMHVGPYEELGTVYPALAAWIQEHGHETNGPSYQLLWTDPSQVSDPAQYRTEVLWPIR